jgi:hypothetical protein
MFKDGLICHIYKKDKNGRYIFDFFGSDLSKLDQIEISHQSKNVTIKSCHIYTKDKMAVFLIETNNLTW